MAIVVALAIAVLIGFLGLALDLGKLYVVRSELQNSADACALASEELTRTIPMTELARRVGAGERSLSRLFRQELGMSYPQWRTNLRLLEAMILLSGGTSVTDTALRCGWNTPSSFIDTFRRALGQTPGEYRAASR